MDQRGGQSDAMPRYPIHSDTGRVVVVALDALHIPGEELHVERDDARRMRALESDPKQVAIGRPKERTDIRLPILQRIRYGDEDMGGS